jgi:hypothetical protein
MNPLRTSPMGFHSKVDLRTRPFVRRFDGEFDAEGVFSWQR